MAKVFGIDTSTHTGLFDYAKAKAKGAEWVIFKGTDVGSATNAGFVDNQAFNSYNNARAQNLLVGSFHWMDARRSGSYQANYYLDNIYSKMSLDFPPILDVEEAEGLLNKKEYIYQTKIWLEIIEAATGRLPIIYSANWYLSNFDKNLIMWMSRYPLWVAYYSNVSAPVLPFPWFEYKIWQYASNASFPYYTKSGGNPSSWGSKGSGLDMNWFNGSMDDLLGFINEPSVPLPVDPVAPIYKARCNATNNLRVRSGAGTEYPQLRSIKFNEIVNIYGEMNGWLKVSPTASEWSMKEYLDRIPDEILPPQIPIRKAKVKFDATPYLNVRSNPGVLYPVVGKLYPNDIIDVYVETSKWLRISNTEDKWCMKEYTEPYSEDPAAPPAPPEIMGELEYLYFPYDEYEGFRVTQVFGTNPAWYPKAKGHNGGDFGIPPWTKIYAAREGRVIRADFNPDGYGRSIWIQHYDSNGNRAGRTIYGHMKQMIVNVGDIVSAKQLLGYSNGEPTDPYSGFSTGAHLHFEYRWDKPSPEVPGGYVYWAVDPFPLLISWDLPDAKPLEKLYSAKVTAHGLLIRTGAGMNYHLVGSEYYKYGDTIDIYEINGDWVRTSPKTHKWVNSNYISKI